ncbi:hypothetical protein D9615_004720 [Tricholomella constricta]|uniref:Barwin domain-containing protein n=1 Tax=Tricholomella constricta TaxID=117010 RepID=A0A8H5HBU8_9AGAR|nr:hypothetical protein D9615_004720 [Tricholomella constricta]
MSSSLGFYTLFTTLAAFFFALTLAAPTSELRTRDFGGKATYFAVGLGSCGQQNVDSDYIVALNPSTYAGGAHCGKQLRITGKASGASATATVRDKCPGCGPGDLDMSPSLFSHFEPLEKGTFQVEWKFL